MDNKLLNLVVTKFSLAVRGLTLIALLIVLSFLMVKQTYSIGVLAVYHPENVHNILEQVVNFFLYFAFFSMIVSYFKNGEYFQLRNLIYIGITGTLRFIIVNRSDAFQNLLLSIVILLLIFGYLLLTPSEERLRSYLKAKGRKIDEQKRAPI